MSRWLEPVCDLLSSTPKKSQNGLPPLLKGVATLPCEITDTFLSVVSNIPGLRRRLYVAMVLSRDLWLLGLRASAGEQRDDVIGDGNTSRWQIHALRQLERRLPLSLSVRSVACLSDNTWAVSS